MKILVLNCGSATAKFQLLEVDPSERSLKACRKLARGLVDRIGGQTVATYSAAASEPEESTRPIRDHEEAVGHILAWLGQRAELNPKDLSAAGHRVVHGGERFASPVLIDDGVISGIEELSELAPLHNPACLSGIHAARKILGDGLPMVAVFDTSFHHNLPEYASIYAIPFELSRRHSIRRYGFHGLAHSYLALRYAEITGVPEHQVKIVTLHLGNGCSATAIRGGKSVDTSMGFTPLEGLVMGTRSGDLDAAIIGFLGRKEGLSVGEMESLLNERSGLLGLSGRSNDMRDLIENASFDPRSRLAVDVFCYRARKYLGAYLAALDGADAVIFSGGIGENSPEIRERICAGMDWCGLLIDPELNRSRRSVEGPISPPEAKLPAYVIPVDEERVIALETVRLVADPK